MFRRIEREAGERRARGYVAALTAFCRSLDVFPERGARRDDIRPGLRIIGWRRRAVIAVRLQGDEVIILGVFHGGQCVMLDAD